jgi:anti-sigma B factor antagonist/stage II sporulation protein AA (anti-sigma F factor antagonist)
MLLVLEEPPFSVDVAWSRNTATVSISGEVDLATAAELDECLLEVVTKHPDHLVLDLAQLRFIDCSGAAVLARARAALLSAGGTMALLSPNRLVRLVLRLTELESSCQAAT